MTYGAVTLDTLPTELQWKIFELLPPDDLQRLSLVNHTMYKNVQPIMEYAVYARLMGMNYELAKVKLMEIKKQAQRHLPSYPTYPQVKHVEVWETFVLRTPCFAPGLNAHDPCIHGFPDSMFLPKMLGTVHSYRGGYGSISDAVAVAVSKDNPISATDMLDMSSCVGLSPETPYLITAPTDAHQIPNEQVKQLLNADGYQIPGSPGIRWFTGNTSFIGSVGQVYLYGTKNVPGDYYRNPQVIGKIEDGSWELEPITTSKHSQLHDPHGQDRVLIGVADQDYLRATEFIIENIPDACKTRCGWSYMYLVMICMRITLVRIQGRLRVIEMNFVRCDVGDYGIIVPPSTITNYMGPWPPAESNKYPALGC